MKLNWLQTPVGNSRLVLLCRRTTSYIKLRARLVVLSCYHSAQEEVSSEGVVSRACAFFFAGALFVLVTHWTISEEATMMIMRCFYRHLRSGNRTSAAFQKAMKRLRDSGEFSSPK